MSDKVIFHIARFFPPSTLHSYTYRKVDLYEEIKSGRKTIEYRDASEYWLRRLCFRAALKYLFNATEKIDLSPFLKVRKAWFIVGYPKGNLPRLEVDITGLTLDPEKSQLHIHLGNVVEKRNEQE